MEEKCPFVFLRRKILPRYYKLPKVEGEKNALLWAVEKFKRHLNKGNPLFVEPLLGAGGFVCIISLTSHKTTPIYKTIYR